MNIVQISQQQAREFASTIFADIRAYVESHQEDYKAFLKEEGLCNQEGSGC